MTAASRGTLRLFVDTMVLAYAVGGAHDLREPCRALLRRAAQGEVELHGSVEAVQELLFHRLRRGERSAAVEVARLVRDLVVLHPFNADVLGAAIDLVDAGPIGGRDAVHAATALGAGFTQIVTTDVAFDSVSGLTRLDPRQA